MSGQVTTEACLDSQKSDAGGKGTVAERQKNRNEEVAIHSLRACREDRMACQETMEARLECEEPIERAIAILEQMIDMTKTNREKMEATEFKPNPEDMESESEHREVVKPVKGRKKQHRGRKLAAGRRGKPKEWTRGDWIPEEVGCRLQEGVLSCSSGTGIFGPREIVDSGMNWPQPAEG
jgi:hypothetical protein